MTVRCTPDEREYTHLLSLTGVAENGDVITVGLNPLNNKGEPDIHAVRYSGYPTSTPRVNSGSGEFSVLRPPYGQFSRRDWSGGIGILNGDSDETKYWFGKHIWSVNSEKLTLAPRLFKANIAYPARMGNNDSVQKPITWVNCPVGTRFAWYITATYNMTGIEVLLRTFVENAITLEFRSDNAGSPGTLLSSVTDTHPVLGSNRYQFLDDYVAGSYWLVVYATDTIEVATCAATSYTVKMSTDGGSNWAASSNNAPVFTVMSNVDCSDWVFFNYKWGTYVAAGQRLFINGDRGACDSNSGDLYTLVDATKNWTVNQWAGAIVKLNAAPLGWRRIVSNTATTLTLDRPWSAAHTTDNWYVILGSPYWTEITGHGFTSDVWDAVTVRQDIVYFAMGPDKQIIRMREYNNSGTWTRQFAAENQSGDLPGANFLEPVYDQTDGPVLYRVVNGNGFVAKAPATSWGTDLVWGTEIEIGNDNWEDLTGVTEYSTDLSQLAVTAMDSAWFVKNGSAAKVNIDMENQWTRYTGRRPTVMPPYLVFPFGNRVQRLYGSVVESFGPEVDNGVPKRYDGDVMDCLSIVGGLVIVKDGGKLGEYPHDAEGGAFLYRNGGWHPLAYTGLGSGMRAAYYQRCEDEMDFLWFGDRNGLWYMQIPRSWDFTQDAKYDQTNRIDHDGWFITGWYDTGRVLPQKWWDFISVFANNLSANQKIRVYYQLSDGEETDNENLAEDWKFADEITGGYNNTITLDAMGRRIRFLFMLMGSGDATPELVGYSISYLSRDDDAESWTAAIKIADKSVDLCGHPEDYNAKELSDILNYWSRTVRPLTMRSIYAIWDNRQVLIERPSVVPLELRPEGDERHFASITIKGIEEPADDPESSEDVCPLDAPINGPYTIALAGTVKPDETTVLFGTANYVIRTAQHANKTTYSITGTFYGLDENGDWVETSDDDFYEVRAHDKDGNIVAVGTHDPVDPDNLGVRTGTFTTTAATRIASISVHILGTALRPTTVNYNLANIHLWFPSTANFEWGFTEYGVWARATNQNYATTTLSGWDYLQDFWFMGSTIYLGAAGEFAGKDILAKHYINGGSYGTSLLTRADGQEDLATAWEENFTDFTGGTYTTSVHEFTLSPGAGETPEVRGWFHMHIYDYSDFDFRINHYVWFHYPPENKISITSATISNVCP